MSSSSEKVTLEGRSTASDQVGFLVLLWDMIARLKECSICLYYLVYKSTPHLLTQIFTVEVYVCPGTLKDGKPLIYQGATIPTARLAIQATAEEAVTRLRTISPKLGAMRGYCYFPHAIGMDKELTYPRPSKEEDPAIVQMIRTSTPKEYCYTRPMPS